MKKYILGAVLFLGILASPSFTHAAALTNVQAETIINVVKASPSTPASAFINLITAFSGVTDAQASSLIVVVQSAPNTVASAFVPLLTSFTSITATQTTNTTTQTTTASYTYEFKHTATLIGKMIVGLVPADLTYDINGNGVIDLQDEIKYMHTTVIPDALVNGDKAYLVGLMLVDLIPDDLKYDFNGDGTITLLDETGYAGTATPTASSLPDLSAGVISPTSVTTGVSTSLSTTISNTGGSTGTSFWTLFQTAGNAAGQNVTNIGNRSSAALALNGSATVSSSYTFTSAGTYYVRACADKRMVSATATGIGTITESDEDNNCGAWTAVTVSAPATYSCTGLPSTSSTIAIFANDTTGLTANTAYTYSATDTSAKCEYTCRSGYTWNGSSCATPTTATPTATIDQNSSTKTAGTFSLTGSASNTSNVAVFLVSSDYATTGYTYEFVSNYDNALGQIPKDGFMMTSSSVSGGRWSAPFSVRINASYLVFVYDTTSKRLLTTGTLTITAPVASTPTITVVSPNGGQTYPLESDMKVDWSVSNMPTGGYIIAQLVGESREVTLGLTYQQTNTDNYYISAKNNIVPGKYRIRISIAGVKDGEGAIDSSDGDITITAPVPAASVTSPLTAIARTPFTISGTAMNTPYVKIVLSSGGSVSTVIPVTSGNWTITYPSGQSAGSWTIQVYACTSSLASSCSTTSLTTRTLVISAVTASVTSSLTISANTPIVFSGTASPVGSSVFLTVGSLTGTALVSSSGTWSVDFSAVRPTGFSASSYPFTVRSFNGGVVGNILASGTLTVTAPITCSKGDVDGNGEISQADQEQVLRYVVESVTLTDAEKSRADVNGDSLVNLTDSIDIGKYIARLITTFPTCATGTIGLPIATITSGLNQTASAVNAFTSATNAGAGTSPGASSFSHTFTLDLYRGMQGAEVVALQQALKAEGVFGGEITSNFYDQTREAVLSFQIKYGISATGYVGPLTRTKLNELY